MKNRKLTGAIAIVLWLVILGLVVFWCWERWPQARVILGWVGGFAALLAVAGLSRLLPAGRRARFLLLVAGFAVLGVVLGWLEIPVWTLLAAALAALAAGWFLTVRRLRGLVERLNRASAAYQASRDGAAFLAETEACRSLRGLGSMVLDGIPARDYLALLRIRTLREQGRTEEGLAELRALMDAAPGAEVLNRCREEEKALLMCMEL